MATSATWSVPGSQSSYITTGPYLAGAIKISVSRASISDLNVNLSCTVGLGFGTYSDYNSHTSDTFTASVVYGGSTLATGEIYSEYFARTSSTLTQIVSGVSQTAYPTIAVATLNYTIPGWGGNSRTFYVNIFRNGSQVKQASFVLDCPEYSSTQYTLTYDGNGAIDGSMSPQSYAYDASGTTYITLTKNTFTRTGYTYKGYWSIDTSSDSGAHIADEARWYRHNVGNRTLYAQWTPNSYTIQYNANGGSGSMANTSMTYDVSANLRTNTFTRTGYRFSHWTDARGRVYTDGQSVKNLTPSGVILLSANWVQQFSVTYDGDGATSNVPSNSGSLDAGSTYTIPNLTPVKSGHTFTGWKFGDIVKQPGNNITIDKNYVFTAQWEVSYRVTYYYWNTSSSSLGGHSEPTSGSIAAWTPGNAVPSVYISGVEYVFSGYWEQSTLVPSGTLTAFSRTESVSDTFKNTDVEQGTSITGITGNRIYKAIYQPKNSLYTISYAGASFIRTNSNITSTAFKNMSESEFASHSVDTGQYICGYVKFNVGYSAGTSILLRAGSNSVKGLLGTTDKRIDISTTNGQAPSSTSPTVSMIFSGNTIYLYCTKDIGRNQETITYYANLVLNNVKNDYGVYLKNTTESGNVYKLSVVIPSVHYTVDINANGNMLAFGGKSYDKMTGGSFDTQYIPTYTHITNTRGFESVSPDTVLAVYDPIYVANASQSLIPAITEGKIEDELILSATTISTWKQILGIS